MHQELNYYYLQFIAFQNEDSQYLDIVTTSQRIYQN